MSIRLLRFIILTTGLDTISGVFCNVIGFLFNYTSRTILFLLAIAATDRAIALFIPFKYKQIVSLVSCNESLYYFIICNKFYFRYTRKLRYGQLRSSESHPKSSQINFQIVKVYFRALCLLIYSNLNGSSLETDMRDIVIFSVPIW